MHQLKFSEKSINEIHELANKIKCLIVTTTEVETAMFREKFKPVDESGIIRFFYKSNTLFIGKFGNYLVGHVQCTSMGSISPGGSTSTVNAGIEFFKPNAVVMPGIAFGINRKKQKIGDVIVSESIIPYNVTRVSKDVTLYRNNIPVCSNVLINRFKNGFLNWNFPLKNNTTANVIFGKVLSGESLIDNLDYRDTLTNEFAGVVGGEMEGAGLFAAAHEHRVEWIIVKGICDFADGNKGKRKSFNQKIAAQSAIALCEHVLSMQSVLDELNIPAFSDKRSERKVFNEKWPLHDYKHFEILTPVLTEQIDERNINIKASIKNIKNEIGTCYMVIKCAQQGNQEDPCFNTDIDLDEEAVKGFKIYDIYPGEYKIFEKSVELPASMMNKEIEIKIEVWSPKRLDAMFSSDSRIALFDRSSWQKVM